MFLDLMNTTAMNFFFNVCADGNVQEEFLWAIFESEIAGSLVLLVNERFFQSGCTNLSYQECESIPVPPNPYQYCQTLNFANPLGLQMFILAN